MANRHDQPVKPTTGQRAWRRFCRFAARTFYRRVEIHGTEHLPETGALILCANHVNALVDAVVVQAASPRAVHPIARSGLFRSPLLRPILSLIQAVPIYRRPTGDEAKRTSGNNEDSFRTCYEYLEQGRAILIFPEGQSHSDPMLRPLKTGAARLAFGHHQRTGELPTVVPVGLTFTHKGRFRSSVLIQIGEPVEFEAQPTESDEQAVKRYTADIDGGLRTVTLNADSWEDLSLARLLQEFFTLRGSGHREKSLEGRFRAYQRLIDTHRALRAEWPERVADLRTRLQEFHDLCRRYGVRDYQLTIQYRPPVVLRFVTRSLLFVVFVLPLALYGLINSALPFFTARELSRRSARGRDQYDTAGMLYGLVCTALFWGAQVAFVAWRWGTWPAATAYALSLPLTAAVALAVSYRRHRMQEEVRVFLLFSRRRRLQTYLRDKRAALEQELARMAQLAKRVTNRPLSP